MTGGGKICAECKKYLIRWESDKPDDTCPKAEWKNRATNLANCLPFDSACNLFQPKYKPKPANLDMKKTLELLNNQTYKCPTDTETVLVYNNGLYEKAKPLIWNILESEYGDSLKRHFVTEAYGHLQRANTIDRSEINQYINKIPIKNGLFNFLTREIEPFDSKWVFTYSLNTKYDPEAKCPNWLEFVKQIIAEDAIPLLQEIMGYCLLPAMPYHKMFWFYGTGRNGKGVVIRTLEAILGKDSCGSLNLTEFREKRRFSLCQLYGKLINVSSEPPLSKHGLPTTILKMVTGEDTISAEIKGKNERLNFTNFAKLLVLGNHFPKVEDSSLGWWDRVTVLNFPNNFTGENQIPNIENRWIPEEISGIFNWMLEGLYRIYENNGFSSSKTIEETKTEFMKVSDPFNAWILEKCVKIPNIYLTREEALTEYLSYCDEIGADRDSKRAFYQKMRQTTGVKDTAKKIAGKPERVFEGITLRIDEDQEQTELNEVAKVAEVTGLHTRQSLNNPNNIEDKNTATSVTSATAKTLNIDKTFTQLQCFDCRKILTEDIPYTYYESKAMCFPCKDSIEAQKKKKSEIGVSIN